MGGGGLSLKLYGEGICCQVSGRVGVDVLCCDSAGGGVGRRPFGRGRRLRG